MQRSKWGMGLILALGLLGRTAQADTAAAAAAYKQAQQFQAAKQWGNAVKAYQAALAADPKYIWAYKGLGTTYYLAGDKKSAVTYYDRYLAANPSDAQTKTFADRLRGQPAAGATTATAAATPVAAAAAASPGKPFKAGLSLGLGAGMVLAGADDLNKPSAGVAGALAYPGSTALGGDLGLDYGLDNGFVIGLKAGFGPNRSHSLSFSGFGYTVKDTVDISNILVGITPGYRFAVGDSGWVEARLGLSYLMATAVYTYSDPYFSASTKFTASGYAIWPELGYTMKFTPSLGGSLSLGYMISSTGALVDDKGNKYQYYTAGSTTPQDFTLSTGGLSLHLGLSYFL